MGGPLEAEAYPLEVEAYPLEVEASPYFEIAPEEEEVAQVDIVQEK